MENYPAPAVEQLVPRKKTWLMPVVVLGIFGAIFLAGLVGVILEGPVTVLNTEVGACLKGEIDKPSGVENSECGTPDANFKVVGKRDGTSEVALRFSGGIECDEYPAVDAYLFQAKAEATEGVLLCLENLKNPGQRPPVVGDCLPGDVDEAKKFVKVDCAAAGYKVLAVEKKPGVSFTDDTCAQAPSTDAKLSWHRPSGLLPQERVLCLDKLR